MNDVVRDPGWAVTLAGTDEKQALMARFSKASTLSRAGSEIIADPGWMVTEDSPLNVSWQVLAGSTADPPVDRATVAAAIVSGPSPWVFAKVTRIASPPKAGWMI
jgi:hypothetical protein